MSLTIVTELVPVTTIFGGEFGGEFVKQHEKDTANMKKTPLMRLLMCTHNNQPPPPRLPNFYRRLHIKMTFVSDNDDDDDDYYYVDDAVFEASARDIQNRMTRAVGTPEVEA